MQAGNRRPEIDLQFRRRRRGGGVEEKAILRANAEAELQVETNGHLDIAVAFEAKPRNANIELNRVAGSVDEGDLFLEAELDGQTGVAVQLHIELTVALSNIQGIACVIVDQQIQSGRPDRIPESLLDRVFNRSQSIASRGADIV